MKADRPVRRNGDAAAEKRAKAAVNAAIELLHRRWVLRIIWELRRDALTFRQLQEACNDISPSVLNGRLRELRSADVVCHLAGEGYQLSEQGRRLLVAMRPMIDWALAWHAPAGRSPAKRTAPARADG